MIMSAFVPHGQCLLWTWPLIVLIVLGNLTIATAYSYIPWKLYLTYRAGNLSLPPVAQRVLIDFALFIFFCGGGHAWAIWLLWHGGQWYWAEALWSLFGTGIFSWRAALFIGNHVPTYIQILKTPVDIVTLMQRNEKLEAHLAAIEKASAG